MAAMLRYKHVRFLDPDPDRIRAEFDEGPPTYGRLFSLFLIHYAEREGKPRWGAQTGLVERYADHLFEAYPGVKVIHMIRDPRDRYEASLALWPDGRGRAGGAAARWRYSVRLAERNLRRHPGEYKVVRFEDMVMHTEEVVREVCVFLGESFVPEMLGMPAARKHREMLAARAGRAPADGPLSNEFIGAFRARIPRREIAFIQLQAGRLMRAYGYPPDRLDLSAKEWARFAVIDWPDQLVRSATWRAREALQQRLPRIVGRRPAAKMIIDVPGEGSA
jgi:hypothetical protein